MTKQEFINRLARNTGEEDKGYTNEGELIYSDKEITFEQFLQVIYTYEMDLNYLLNKAVKGDEVDRSNSSYYAGEGNMLHIIRQYAERVKEMK